jgi:hypothetical protein
MVRFLSLDGIQSEDNSCVAKNRNGGWANIKRCSDEAARRNPAGITLLNNSSTSSRRGLRLNAAATDNCLHKQYARQAGRFQN